MAREVSHIRKKDEPRVITAAEACPLMALSGLSDAPITRSAFGPIANMPNEYVECPLMTQSGHRKTKARRSFISGPKAQRARALLASYDTKREHHKTRPFLIRASGRLGDPFLDE